MLCVEQDDGIAKGIGGLYNRSQDDVDCLVSYTMKDYNRKL